jgi:23S rRNA (adenine2503-C2)-methyltransferase
MPIHVNLIPVNEVKESGFRTSGKDAVLAFAKVLESKGIRATVRRTLGADINASCGQLRRAAMDE